MKVVARGEDGSGMVVPVTSHRDKEVANVYVRFVSNLITIAFERLKIDYFLKNRALGELILSCRNKLCSIYNKVKRHKTVGCSMRQRIKVS